MGVERHENQKCGTDRPCAVGGFFAPAFLRQLGEEKFCVIADGERKKRLEEGVKINGEIYDFPLVTPKEAFRWICW